MKLPNAHNAVIDSEKIIEYVLSFAHPVGRFKARFFQSIRFNETNAIHFIVHGYTEADLLAETVEQAARLEDITLLAGWIPYFMRTEEGGPIRTHRDVDQRARAFAEKIARLLTNDPSIIERALRWIDTRLKSADDRLVHELDEWRRILNELSIRQIQSLLREDSERADRLRQSLPFIEALTETERREILKGESL